MQIALLLLVSALILVVALGYWLLVTTEGVFLGRRMVVWLYDITARRYDQVKQYEAGDERILVTNPILEATRTPALLADGSGACILDVATGTGRVPFDLLQSGHFTGHIVGLDASRKMLAVARAKLAPYSGQVSLVMARAGKLPLPDAWFDVVVCLEALEFFPSDELAIAELVRVLRPGGALFVTRRCGREGKMFLHRYRTETEFLALLRAYDVPDARAFNWEVGYDLIVARKALTGQKANPSLVRPTT